MKSELNSVLLEGTVRRIHRYGNSVVELTVENERGSGRVTIPVRYDEAERKWKGSVRVKGTVRVVGTLEKKEGGPVYVAADHVEISRKDNSHA